MFEIGDRVYYTSGKHSTGKGNPLLGTEWECAGTIRAAHRIHVSVLWDNGTSNAYAERDLTHIAEILCISKTNPNIAFLRRKLRRNHG